MRAPFAVTRLEYRGGPKSKNRSAMPATTPGRKIPALLDAQAIAAKLRCSIHRTLRPIVAAGLAAVALLAAGPAAAEDNSAFASQSVPASMSAGTRVSVSVTFTNTGTTSWTVSGGYVLGCPSPVNSATWEVSSVALPSAVEVGSSVTFSFRVNAPITPGTYNFQWQLEHGTTFFGATSTSVAVKVVAPPTVSIASPIYRAAFAAPA